VFERILAQLGLWLERWAVDTCVRRPAGRQLLARAVLEPAARLAERLEDGGGYVRWLEARCFALEDREIPLIATHGDLTMSNVLVPEEGPLGIIDWEAAGPQGWPLQDFHYAAADAAAALGHYHDRVAAFESCLQREHRVGRIVHEVSRRLERALDLAEEVRIVAVHACWLRHAENEARKRGPGEATPFLSILQRVAARRGDLER
jgi:aminoglycoside phosphotransferase (APT) family kinase protein